MKDRGHEEVFVESDDSDYNPDSTEGVKGKYENETNDQDGENKRSGSMELENVNEGN